MLTENVQNIVIIVVFIGVIAAIAFDVIDMLVAALLGVCVLIIFGIFKQQDILNVTRTAGGPLALLFGGMVVARVLVPTGIFEYVGSRYLLATRGSGKRFLLSLFLLVGPLCAVLPNATTVILLAPIIIRVALALEVDFVGPMIVTAIISNSAGLLTLVGDPATFLVGSSIGMTFTAVSPEGEPGRSPLGFSPGAPPAVVDERPVAGGADVAGRPQARAAAAALPVPVCSPYPGAHGALISGRRFSAHRGLCPRPWRLLPPPWPCS